MAKDATGPLASLSRLPRPPRLLCRNRTTTRLSLALSWPSAVQWRITPRVIDSIESQIASLSVMMKTISQNFKPVTTPMRSANNTQYSHQNFTVDASREGTGSLYANPDMSYDFSDPDPARHGRHAEGGRPDRLFSRLCRATGLASHALPYRPPARQHVDPLSSNTAAAYLPASLCEIDDIIIHL